MALAGRKVRLLEFEQFCPNVAEISDSRAIELTGLARTGTGHLAVRPH
jgi:hypothetical protein